MAGNQQFRNIALNNAEAALASAEKWLSDNMDAADFAVRVPGGLYPPGTMPDPVSMTWDDTNSMKADGGGAQRFAIELLSTDHVRPLNSLAACTIYAASSPCPRVNLYRVTARGTSVFGSSKVVQSIYAVPTNS
jgi:Tfp pilus assembly protein PilX